MLAVYLGVLGSHVAALQKPILTYGKVAVAKPLNSQALHADAMETAVCSYLSFALLLGLGLNSLLGWWWADPVAGLLMLPLIVREGYEAVRESRERQ